MPNPASLVVSFIQNDGRDIPENIVECSDANLYVIDGGMHSGLPSIAIGVTLPTGQTALYVTSARLLVIAANAITARYGDLSSEGVSSHAVITYNSEPDPADRAASGTD